MKRKSDGDANVLGVTALLLGFFCFTGANALLTTQVVLQARALTFPAAIIGLLTSLYFCGFIGGCLFGGKLVARVGHIRSFAGLAALATIAALVHPLAPVALVWMVLRTISGFSHAVLQMTAESWLNSVSTTETRSRTLSIYRIVDLGSVTIAQFALMLDDSTGFLIFALIAISISAALLPLTLSRTTGPTAITQARPEVSYLVRQAPMAAAGAATFGLVSGGFWGLAPVFLAGAGYGGDIVAIFLSLAIVGGAVSQWPIGRVSDRMDRRRVILGCGIGAIASCMMIALTVQATPLLLAAAFLFGASAMPLYALAVSHANDAAEPGTFVGVAGALLLCFGVGAVLGPLVLSVFIGVFGDGALFIGVALALAALVAFGLWRMSARAERPQDDKSEFVPVPAGSPDSFQIDPRGDADEDRLPSAA